MHSFAQIASVQRRSLIFKILPNLLLFLTQILPIFAKKKKLLLRDLPALVVRGRPGVVRRRGEVRAPGDHVLGEVRVHGDVERELELDFARDLACLNLEIRLVRKRAGSVSFCRQLTNVPFFHPMFARFLNFS